MVPENKTTNLTNLLEKDAVAFLKYIRDENNYQQVKLWFEGGSKTYNGYLSPAPILLFMLCGKATDIGVNCDFFGSHLREGIPEKLALEIFEEFTKFPMDPSDKNYYDEYIGTFIQTHPKCLTHRVDNDALKSRMIEHFKLKLVDTPTPTPTPCAPSFSKRPLEERPQPTHRVPSFSKQNQHNSNIVTPSTDVSYFNNFIYNIDKYYHQLKQKLGQKLIYFYMKKIKLNKIKIKLKLKNQKK